MGVLAFSLSVLLAADASAGAGAVLVTRRSGLTVPQAAELRTQLERSLVTAGVPLTLEGKALAARLSGLGVKDPAACNGRRSCVLELGRQLALPTVISVSISRVDGDSAVALELIRIDGDVALSKDSFVLPKGSKDLASLVAGFAQATKAALAPPPPPEVKPPPPPVTLVPKETPPEPLVQVTPAPAPPRSHTAGWVLGGAGVAAALVGGALLTTSFVMRAPLTAGSGSGGYAYSTSPLTEREASVRASEADQFLGAGIGATAAGLGLLLGGVIAW